MSGQLNGAEQVVRVLLDCGVEVMFANPGTTEMQVVQALDTVPGMRPVLGLHENVVTGAADGYGRMTGRPAATLLHLGVGLANGLANLHNARRAGSPVINIVGEMATWHREADALLSMDIEGLAATVSSFVATPDVAGNVPHDVARCVEAVQPGAVDAGGSRVATLVLPHDCAREPAEPLPTSRLPKTALPEDAFERALEVAEATGDRHLPNSVARAAEALRVHGKAACLLVGGEGTWAGASDAAGRISTATGCILACEPMFARVDRGGGTPQPLRIPYFPNDAKKELSKYKAVVLVGARLPVAMFGYEDGISQLVDCEVQDVVSVPAHDVPGALTHLCRVLDAESSPVVPEGGKPVKLPAVPKGPLNAVKLCSCIALRQPEAAIIVDESLTSGGSYWNASLACPAFTHLTLTGGAIGQGPPLAVGAAIACPDRRVINLQADGSCLYTTQALWTQQRENLKVTTVICNNSVYQILRVEQNKQRLSQKGDAAKSLTDLSGPAIDWVALGRGYGVESVRVSTCEELLQQLEKALAHNGPYLIEARL